MNKYVGETEKNLDQLFDSTSAANCVLFFDEAHARFGERTEVQDSHDRYANLEVSNLLQRLETYEGLAILASNLAGDRGWIARFANRHGTRTAASLAS